MGGCRRLVHVLTARRELSHGVGTTRPLGSATGFFSALHEKNKTAKKREATEKREQNETLTATTHARIHKDPLDQTRGAHCWNTLHAPHCVEFYALRFNPCSEWCHKTVVSVDSSFRAELPATANGLNTHTHSFMQPATSRIAPQTGITCCACIMHSMLRQE